MYRPHYYKEERPEQIRAFIDGRGLAMLVSGGVTGLQATHLPLLADWNSGSNGVLKGHMARANTQWRSLNKGDAVLAVFEGPNCYVSPNAYADEPDVPTWNYKAAHVQGTWQLCEDQADVVAHLQEIVDRYERGVNSDWRLDSLERSMFDGLFNGIVAFELHIDAIVCAFKLNQDKTVQDRNRVIEWIDSSLVDGGPEVACAMRDYYL